MFECITCLRTADSREAIDHAELCRRPAVREVSPVDESTPDPTLRVCPRGLHKPTTEADACACWDRRICPICGATEPVVDAVFTDDTGAVERVIDVSPYGHKRDCLVSKQGWPPLPKTDTYEDMNRTQLDAEARERGFTRFSKTSDADLRDVLRTPDKSPAAQEADSRPDGTCPTCAHQSHPGADSPCSIVLSDNTTCGCMVGLFAGLHERVQEAAIE